MQRQKEIFILSFGSGKLKRRYKCLVFSRNIGIWKFAIFNNTSRTDNSYQWKKIQKNETIEPEEFRQ